MKYTPGPWNADQYKSAYVIQSDDLFYVADVHIDMRKQIKDYEKLMARLS
jgi:hypothetical protein